MHEDGIATARAGARTAWSTAYDELRRDACAAEKERLEAMVPKTTADTLGENDMSQSRAASERELRATLAAVQAL